MFKLFGRILRLSGTYKKQIQLAFVFSVLKSMLSHMPIFVAFVVLNEFYQQAMDVRKCLLSGIALISIVLLETLSQYISDRLQSAAGFKMFAEKRLELGAHLKKLPMGYFTDGNIGKISSVLSTDMIFIEEVSMTTLANMMSYVFSAIIMILFMAAFDFRLGAILLAVSLLAVLTAGKMNQMLLDQSAIRQEQSEKLTDAVISFTSGISIIKSYNLLGEKSSELTGNIRRSKEAALEFETKATPWQRTLYLFYAAGVALLFGLAICLQQKGLIPLPELMGLLLFVFNVFGPLKALFGEATRLTVMNSCLDRIEAVFDEVQLPDQGTETISKSQADIPEICFDNVSFAYGTKDVIKNISFTVPANTMLALVGPSGGGKSTVANLLARFWDIRSGSIQIRGQDIRNVPVEELMNHISMVFQRVYLFQDTIYHNISMGKPGATREEVYEAARKARCYEFITELPKGFETVVGEGGATLSGGEKQRISIARCILKDAPIVILDEATASVDVDNERYIQEAITALVKGKTLLVIAHRLNTIQAADQIIVIAEGQAAQCGTHQTLISEPGIYQEFVKIRSRSVNMEF
ncbi:MAG: ABC transporter ATP-binding protein [Lachnospiraceae bacterium]